MDDITPILQPDAIRRSDRPIVTRGLMESETGVLWCGNNSAAFRQDAGVCKWPMLRVTTSQRISGLQPLSADDEHRAWLQALKLWNDASGLELVYTDDFNSANIYASPGPMDSGILAYSYLPCGAGKTSRMEQRYNQAVRWSFALLVDTITHEIGHAIGLDHSGSNADIMRPFSNGQMGKLGPGDIAEVVKRYGKYVPKPEPPKPEPPKPEPPTDDGGKIVLTISRDLSAGTYTITPTTGGDGGNGFGHHFM